MAAVLYCGTGAVVSHATAAELCGMRRPSADAVHVTVPVTRRVVAQPGVVIHRTRRLDAAALDLRAAPVRTCVDRTVVDLLDGAASHTDALALVLAAIQSRLTTATSLSAAIAEAGNVRWRATALDAAHDAANGTHSLLEYRYKTAERRHGLPDGRGQGAAGPVGRRWLDILYDAANTPGLRDNVNIELDGRLGHADVLGRWRDMRSDNAAAFRARVVLRYGWLDLGDGGCAAVGQVAAMLVERGWTGGPRRCGGSCVL